jgi:hypothetical protein
MDDLTTCVTIEESFHNKGKGSRILLPLPLFIKIERLCNKDVEVAGQLICKVTRGLLRDNYNVEYVAILSEGEPHKVMLDKRIDLQAGSGYKTVDFHTHTKQSDPLYWNKFSEKDYVMLETESARGAYNHVLFTPDCVLTWGVDKLAFEVYPVERKEEDIIIQNYKTWENQLCK